MIVLTCPTCSTQYYLDPSRLTEAGHRVRCTACGEVWFQEPVPEEGNALGQTLGEGLMEGQAGSESAGAPPLDLSESRPETNSETNPKTSSGAPSQKPGSFQEALDSIPASVRPAQDQGPVLPGRAAPRKAAFAVGASAALLLFFGACAGGVAVRDRLVMRWPPSALVFDALGVSYHLPGQDMTIEGAKAEIVGDPQNGLKLALSGRIINLKSRPIALVPLRVTAVRSGGSGGEEWLYEFPERSLKAESELPFGPSWSVIEGGPMTITLRPDPFAHLKD